jgi:hypothetical protein
VETTRSALKINVSASQDTKVIRLQSASEQPAIQRVAPMLTAMMPFSVVATKDTKEMAKYVAIQAVASSTFKSVTEM